jgi:integrase/recombinase XerD
MTVARLFDEQDRRLFFTLEERIAFLKAANRADGKTRTFCQLLHYTGCTLAESITVTAGQIDFPGRSIILQGTTQRRHDITRAVPVPDTFLALLDEVHIRISALNPATTTGRIWPHDINTMRDKLTRVIREAGIAGGPHAMPRGIRYGFLVHAIRCGVILTRAERWMGYSHTNDLGHYVEQLARFAPDVVGNERDDAALMW